MACFSGPTIVNDGLVLHLDAANYRSYPGSNTTWFDISGNDNHATLVNGPTFSSNNNGCMLLDGTNDVIDSINVASLTDMTIEMWIYDTRSTGQRDILTYNGNLGSYTFNGSGFRTDGNALQGRIIGGVGNPPSNQWYRFCYVKNNDLYVNQTKYTGTGTDRTYGVLSFSNTRSDINRRINGRIASIKVYNRQLTVSEIQQNFEANRGRYGI